MSTSDSNSDEQEPLWGLPDRQHDPLKIGGSVLTIRLSPELLQALQGATSDAMIDRLVLRILNEWAGINEVSTSTDEGGTLSQSPAAEEAQADD